MPSDLLAQQHESVHLSQMQCWWEPKLLQTGVVHCKENWGRQQVQSVEEKRRGGTRALLWQGTRGIMTSAWVNHQWIRDDKCICWLLVDATRNHGKMEHIHSNQISQTVNTSCEWLKNSRKHYTPSCQKLLHRWTRCTYVAYISWQPNTVLPWKLNTSFTAEVERPWTAQATGVLSFYLPPS